MKRLTFAVAAACFVLAAGQGWAQKKACRQKIKCEKAYKCEHVAQVELGKKCPPGLEAEKGKDQGKDKGESAYLHKVLDLLAPEAIAEHGDLHFGYRDGQNLSGGGTQKTCEAKLHVCFRGGSFDQALEGVDSVERCNLACDLSTTPNQIACSRDACVSRCVAARVTNSGTCD